jgi:hypothetical protein
MRGIQYAAAFRFYHRRFWNTGSPAFAGDDNCHEYSGHTSAFPRRNRARVVHQSSAPVRAWGMPGARRTRSRAWSVVNTRVSHHGRTGITRHSRTRVVLTVSFGLSPVIGLSCHRRRRKLVFADLTPASRRQDHTTSPSASAPFVKGAAASTASRPAFVTIASRPSLGRDDERYGFDLGVRSRTPPAADWHDGQSSRPVLHVTPTCY